MEELTLKLTEETPIITHNVRLANPLNEYAQLLKLKSGKRKKTIEDIIELARIEWEGGLYMNDGTVQLPMRVINKTMERGATKSKDGGFWKSGCVIMEDYIPLKYDAKGALIKTNGKHNGIPIPDLDSGFAKHCYQAMVRVGQQKVLRSRPIFYGWSLVFTIMHDPSVMAKDAILQAAGNAGRLVGIGDWNVERGGGFGRFSVEVVA